MSDDFALLHLLRIKGLLNDDQACKILRVDEGLIAGSFARLGAQRLAVERTGRLTGWALTPDGRARHADLLAAERGASGGFPELRQLYAEFGPLNAQIKAAISDWQLAGAESQPDGAYRARRAEVCVRLGALHESAFQLTGQMTRVLARLNSYGPRLSAAKARFDGGEDSALTRPLSESYHDIWMELHQDLLLTLDLARGAADA